jgi:hypothetical protein
MVSIVIVCVMGILLLALFVGRALELLVPWLKERREKRAERVPAYHGEAAQRFGKATTSYERPG